MSSARWLKSPKQFPSGSAGVFAVRLVTSAATGLFPGVTCGSVRVRFWRVKAKNTSRPVSRSGRFQNGPGEDVQAFTESISFDWRLWRQDIAGSKAHATMLKSVGLLSKQEWHAIVKALDSIGDEIAQGMFKWRSELEDVHMNIEAELTRRAPAGAKLHTGRSRNDQVALDMRLWLREEVGCLLKEIGYLQRALVELGGDNSEVIIPGYTHLQRAQPVYLAHHLLAYVEMLARDRQRLEESVPRINTCPLGSGAIAGSTLPLDRAETARLLGFVDAQGQPRLSQNSMDAVSDRDFVAEFCSNSALLAVHLSRLAEDLILWASAEFGFIRIADAYTTGSSLMPQKKNPDVAELTRGKSARVIGNLMSLLTLLKGLPMTYNRDLQEDKERLFDTADTIRATTRLCAAMLANTKVNRAACRAAASDPALLATDLADYLVRKGVPFRRAHHAVGEAVLLAEKSRKPLNELSREELASVHKEFGPEVAGIFDLDQAMSRRELTGAPGTKELKKQLGRWRKVLSP
nr:argininosuccinate lyase [uncultured bacterium]